MFEVILKGDVFYLTEDVFVVCNDDDDEAHSKPTKLMISPQVKRNSHTAAAAAADDIRG